MNEINIIKPIFARHETFHPRFGWFKKGFDKNEVFSTNKKGATTILGVGKNMVNSIRYWSLAFKTYNNVISNACAKSQVLILCFQLEISPFGSK